MTQSQLQIANRLAQVKPSPMMEVNMAAQRLRAEGVDVLNLGMGEPDFDTPAHIIDAAFDAARAGDTHYTPTRGTAALCEAVVEKLKTENGLEYTPDQVVISNGAKQVLFQAMGATLNAGDEVILPAPFWSSYRDMVLVHGGVPVIVPCRPEDDFQITPEALEAAITPRTRWLFVNSPSNPAGGVLDEARLHGLGAVLARQSRVMILSDEIYEHILFDGRQAISFAKGCPELKDRVLTVNGLSKAYAMTGWRIGYGAGPRELIAAMITLQSQVSAGPSAISQAAATAALSQPQNAVETFRKAFEARRDLVVARIEKIPGLTLNRPAGAFYGYIGCAGLLGKTTPEGSLLETDIDVVGYLLTTGRVAAVPGAAFFMSPYFRISLASSDAVLVEACDRIAAAVEQLR